MRAGLEAPQAGGYQRRVGHMRLLGELYNYRVVDSRLVTCAQVPQLVSWPHHWFRLPVSADWL